MSELTPAEKDAFFREHIPGYRGEGKPFIEQRAGGPIVALDRPLDRVPHRTPCAA